MLKTKITIFASLVFASSINIAQAQVETNNGSNIQVQKLKTNNTENAKSDLLNKLLKIKHFTAEFAQRVVDAEGNALQKTTGEISVSKPNLVYWNTQQPDESLLVSDGKTLWVYDPFIEQASAYDLNGAIANTPILLLTSNSPEMWNNYSVSEIDSKTYLVHANDPNSRIQSLELNFTDSAGSSLSGFTFLDASGQLSIVSLLNVNMAKAPNSDLFKFVLPEGAHLDDQR